MFFKELSELNESRPILSSPSTLLQPFWLLIRLLLCSAYLLEFQIWGFLTNVSLSWSEFVTKKLLLMEHISRLSRFKTSKYRLLLIFWTPWLFSSICIIKLIHSDLASFIFCCRSVFIFLLHCTDFCSPDKEASESSENHRN